MMSRKKLETDEDFLDDDLYGSIINILTIAPGFDKIYAEGLQPKELRDLIVKDYSICKETADGQRLNVLSNFRQFLSVNHTNKVRLDQDILKPGEHLEEGKPPSKSSIYVLFDQVLKRIEKKGWISRKNGFCFPVEGHKFNSTLKKWHRDTIADKPSETIDTTGENTFYFDDIKKEEIENSSEFGQMLTEMHAFIDYKLTGMMDIALGFIKKRRAFEFWEEFKSKTELSPILLSYLWLQLLFFSQYKVRNLSLCTPIKKGEHPRDVLKKLGNITPNEMQREKQRWHTLFYQVSEKTIKNILIEKNSFSKNIRNKIQKYNLIKDFYENKIVFEETINRIINILSEKLPYTLILDNKIGSIYGKTLDELPTLNYKQDGRYENNPSPVIWPETRYHVFDHKTQNTFSFSSGQRVPPGQAFYNSVAQMVLEGSCFDNEIDYASKFFIHQNDFSSNEGHKKLNGKKTIFLNFIKKKKRSFLDIISIDTIEKDLMGLSLLENENTNRVFYDGNGYLIQDSPFKNKEKMGYLLGLMSNIITIPSLPDDPNKIFSPHHLSNQTKENNTDSISYDFMFIKPKRNVLDPLIRLKYVD